MREVADGVWQLKGWPPNGINVYLVGDVLVDAATRLAGKRILKQLEGREVSAHALTHAHSDHQGASKEVCEKLGIPFWVSERDADAAETPSLIRDRQPDKLINKVVWKAWAGPGHSVDRRLREGDEVAGFTVLDTPGHSAGHVSFWRESDRVLILGDVLNSMDVVTGMSGLREPKGFFTPDPAENRRSIRRLGELRPSVALFGHGAPVCDTQKFVAFCESVPA